MVIDQILMKSGVPGLGHIERKPFEHYRDERIEGDQSRNVSSESNPLLIDTILDCLFSYAGYEFFKTSRLVCKKWRVLIETKFLSSSRILFATPTDLTTYTREQCHMISKDKLNFAFSEVFIDSKGVQPMPVPKAVRLNGCFTITMMKKIVEQKFLELTFDNITVVDETNMLEVSELDLSDILNQNQTQDSPRISKWAFEVPFNGKTKITVAVSQLAFVEDIKLRGNCELVIDGKMAPKKLHLECASYIQNGQKLATVLVNTFVSFEQLSSLTLEKARFNGPEIQLDMTESSVHLESLNLNSLDAFSWEGASWSVNKLELYDMRAFPMNNFMVIKEMVIINIPLHLDVSKLPTSLEKLSLGAHTTIIGASATQLPKLKFLQLGNPVMPSSFAGFRDCQHLIDLELVDLDVEFRGRFNVNYLQFIPPSVQRVKLFNMYHYQNPAYVSQQNIRFPTLILQSYTLDDAAFILDCVSPENVIISLTGFELPLKPHKIMQLIRSSRFRSITLGPIRWPKGRPKQFCLYPIVDRPRAEYFVFKNGKGSSISRGEFQKKLILNTELSSA